MVGLEKVLNRIISEAEEDAGKLLRSAEEKAAAEQEITSDVYWTTFGRKYHIDQDCQAITNSSTLYQGTVTEAIENGRASLCAFCAAKHPEIAADVKTENAD